MVKVINLNQCLLMSLCLLVVAAGSVFGGTIYVKADAVPGGSGSSWANAYYLLQDGLDDANSGDQVWVAQGTYYPTTKVGGATDRYKTFQMKNGVEIYGGFPNSGNPTLADRDPNTHETVLSGDIGTIGDNSDNCYHVFYHTTGTNLDATAVLDGFIITNGNANGSAPHLWGAGMCNYNNNSPVVTNCKFSANSAYLGGGMCNYTNCNPIVIHCIFSNNLAPGGTGGGMGNLNSSPTVINSIFKGNSATLGGGISNQDSNSIVTNCIFSSNIANYRGGGMFNNNPLSSGRSPEVKNCFFCGNQTYYPISGSDRGGGGICNYTNCNPKVTNCTFTYNKAYPGPGAGGGMYNYSNCNPTINNCTFSYNIAYDYGGGVANTNGSNIMATNCIIFYNMALTGLQIYNDGTSSALITYSDVLGGYSGTGNIDINPLFVDVDGADNVFGTEDDNLHLKSYSPCIDKGDLLGDYSGQTDVDGEERVRYDNVDMGADEVFPIAGDIDMDEDVDFSDFAFFAGHWLKGT